MLYLPVPSGWFARQAMWTNHIEAVELDNREVIFAVKVEELGVAAFSLINRMAIGPRCAAL